MTNVSTETNTRLGTKTKTRRERYRIIRGHTLWRTARGIARRVPAPRTGYRDPTGTGVTELAGSLHPAHHDVSKRPYEEPVDAGFGAHRALRISQGNERRVLEDQTL
jgi:hypothetical protein